MKIRGNTIGTPIKPDKTLVKAQNMLEEQKRQARKNIGAWNEADGVTQLDIHGDNQDEQVGIGIIGVGGNKNPVLSFGQAREQTHPILRDISDGVMDYDAATVGQVRAVDLRTATALTDAEKAQTRKNISAASSTDLSRVQQIAEDAYEATLSVVSFNAQTLTPKQQEQTRKNIDAANLMTVRLNDNGTASATSEQIYEHIQNDGIVVLKNREVYYNLSQCYIDLAVFGYRGDDYVDEYISINDKAIAETITLNYPSEEIFIKLQEDVGDISTALDVIIDIQESLIGGESA